MDSWVDEVENLRIINSDKNGWQAGFTATIDARTHQSRLSVGKIFLKQNHQKLTSAIPKCLHFA